MNAVLHPASTEELQAVWPAARACGLFASPRELEAFAAEAPWRVQVSGRGEAAVLSRWRDHLGICAVRGLWCSERRVPAMMRACHAVARAQGFTDLVSPVITLEGAEPYRSAGMRVAHRIVTMRADKSGRDREETLAPPPGVALRRARADDIPALMAVDLRCFDDFWRSDEPCARRYVEDGRVVVAIKEGVVIGYTQCTAEKGEGMLGRLAVVPPEQGGGVGAALLDDALEYLWRSGAAAVSLCTQEENMRSRSLYERAGFRQVGGVSVFMAFGSGPDADGGEGKRG
ncbi:MAG: GNAT family N-acetyltransferase [Anaerosomatales bacterium]|nr:GNAT family N-acetyltransferase [Anaerosomatales bacterium]